jgi:hypothetical protein
VSRERRDSSDPAALNGGIILPDEQVGMDPAAFDNTVRGKGAPLIHFRAIRCPVGLVDPNDVRRTHDDHTGCSNGFIYKAIGRVTATLTSNATEVRKLDIGFLDGSTVMAVFPRFYDSDPNKRVLVRPFDRFYLEQEDLLTGTWDVAKRRLDGNNDRFEFPSVQVEHLVDSDGVWYLQNHDFDLTPSGDLAWRAGKGPSIGTVYTAWYQYRPYWLVDRLVHELRLFPTHDFVETDKVKMERLGFGAVLQREYVHRTQTPDDQAPDKQNQQKLPPDLDEQDIA